VLWKRGGGRHDDGHYCVLAPCHEICAASDTGFQVTAGAR
jgi:hypothetical protein